MLRIRKEKESSGKNKNPGYEDALDMLREAFTESVSSRPRVIATFAREPGPGLEGSLAGGERKLNSKERFEAKIEELNKERLAMPDKESKEHTENMLDTVAHMYVKANNYDEAKILEEIKDEDKVIKERTLKVFGEFKNEKVETEEEKNKTDADRSSAGSSTSAGASASATPPPGPGTGSAEAGTGPDTKAGGPSAAEKEQVEAEEAAKKWQEGVDTFGTESAKGAKEEKEAPKGRLGLNTEEAREELEKARADGRVTPEKYEELQKQYDEIDAILSGRTAARPPKAEALHVGDAVQLKMMTPEGEVKVDVEIEGIGRNGKVTIRGPFGEREVSPEELAKTPEAPKTSASTAENAREQIWRDAGLSAPDIDLLRRGENPYNRMAMSPEEKQRLYNLESTIEQREKVKSTGIYDAYARPHPIYGFKEPKPEFPGETPELTRAISEVLGTEFAENLNARAAARAVVEARMQLAEAWPQTLRQRWRRRHNARLGTVDPTEVAYINTRDNLAKVLLNERRASLSAAGKSEREIMEELRVLIPNVDFQEEYRKQEAIERAAPPGWSGRLTKMGQWYNKQFENVTDRMGIDRKWAKGIRIASTAAIATGIGFATGAVAGGTVLLYGAGRVALPYFMGAINGAVSLGIHGITEAGFRRKSSAAERQSREQLRQYENYTDMLEAMKHERNNFSERLDKAYKSARWNKRAAQTALVLTNILVAREAFATGLDAAHVPSGSAIGDHLESWRAGIGERLTEAQENLTHLGKRGIEGILAAHEDIGKTIDEVTGASTPEEMARGMEDLGRAAYIPEPYPEAGPLPDGATDAEYKAIRGLGAGPQEYPPFESDESIIEREGLHASPEEHAMGWKRAVDIEPVPEGSTEGPTARLSQEELRRYYNSPYPPDEAATTPESASAVRGYTAIKPPLGGGDPTMGGPDDTGLPGHESPAEVATRVKGWKGTPGTTGKYIPEPYPEAGPLPDGATDAEYKAIRGLGAGPQEYPPFESDESIIEREGLHASPEEYAMGWKRPEIKVSPDGESVLTDAQRETAIKAWKRISPEYDSPLSDEQIKTALEQWRGKTGVDTPILSNEQIKNALEQWEGAGIKPEALDIEPVTIGKGGAWEAAKEIKHTAGISTEKFADAWSNSKVMIGGKEMPLHEAWGVYGKASLDYDPATNRFAVVPGEGARITLGEEFRGAREVSAPKAVDQLVSRIASRPAADIEPLLAEKALEGGVSFKDMFGDPKAFVENKFANQSLVDQEEALGHFRSGTLKIQSDLDTLPDAARPARETLIEDMKDMVTEMERHQSYLEHVADWEKFEANWQTKTGLSPEQFETMQDWSVEEFLRTVDKLETRPSAASGSIEEVLRNKLTGGESPTRQLEEMVRSFRDNPEVRRMAIAKGLTPNDLSLETILKSTL